MLKIVIIGAGFGGLSCALYLSSFLHDAEIIILEKKETSDFLPSLPDVLGRAIAPQHLTIKIEDIAKTKKIKFIKTEVHSLDLDKKEVYTSSLSINYDYLVIASGAETNFYGNENIKKYAYSLDSADDAIKILAALNQKKFSTFIISGGGYTGIEVATNLRCFSSKHGNDAKIVIVEKSQSILGLLPGWMKEYTKRNLSRLNIEVLVGSGVERIENGTVYVSAGKVFDNALVIQAAGVKTAEFIQNLKADKNPQGRLKVDEYLRLNESCFVVGDAAYFNQNGNYLRMAVQFSIAQGDLCAKNIINIIKGRKLRKYQPVDFGYIIPMANNQSCGSILNINLKGFLPTIMHFLMCIYRTYGFKNKIGFLRDLIRGRPDITSGL